MKNDKPVIFDLSVRWKPAQDATRPLQQPSADDRPKFDFPGFTPEETGGGGPASPARVFVVALTLDAGPPAQVVPLASDLVASIESAYTSEAPIDGDVIIITLSGVGKFRAVVTSTDLSALTVTDSSLFFVEFTAGSTTWWAALVQIGLF